MCSDLFTLSITIQACLALNSLLALFVVRKELALLAADLKAVGVAARPFIKNYWLMWILSILAVCISTLRAVKETAFESSFSWSILLVLGSFFIIQMLGFFFISHLASDRQPGLSSTFGLRTLIKACLAESLRGFSTTLGFILLCGIPALIFNTRTMLFLPVFICERQHVGHAITRSWQLTAGNFWQTSAHLGLASAASAVCGSLFLSTFTCVDMKTWQQTISLMAFLLLFLSSYSVFNMLAIGLSFKEYQRLVEKRELNQNQAPKLPNSDNSDAFLARIFFEESTHV